LLPQLGLDVFLKERYMFMLERGKGVHGPDTQWRGVGNGMRRRWKMNKIS